MLISYKFSGNGIQFESLWIFEELFTFLKTRSCVTPNSHICMVFTVPSNNVFPQYSFYYEIICIEMLWFKLVAFHCNYPFILSTLLLLLGFANFMWYLFITSGGKHEWWLDHNYIDKVVTSSITNIIFKNPIPQSLVCESLHVLCIIF